MLTLVHVASQAAGSFSKKFLFDLYVIDESRVGSGPSVVNPLD